MKPSRLVRRLTTFLVAASLAATLPSSAQALGPGVYYDTAVSCDGLTIKNLANAYLLTATDVAVQQRNQTTNSSTTIAWLLRNNGNETGKGRMSNNEMIQWNGVPAGTWTFRVHRSTSANCNGALPGNGNYQLSAIVFR